MRLRYISTTIRESLRDFPAVLLVGARQVGKSSVARRLVTEGAISEYVTLDELSVLEAVKSDPDGFLNGFGEPVAIDEIQRVPDLMRALKRTIDCDRRPGRFLLTGSANVLNRPGVMESMAGRVDVIELGGLSLGEQFEQTQPTLIQDFCADRSLAELRQQWRQALSRPSISSDDLKAQMFFGGFPEVALRRSIGFASRWRRAYMTTYVERDIRDLSRLDDVVPFFRFVRLAGMRTAGMLNLSALGAEAGVDKRTANRFLGLLELTFQMSRLHPWHANVRKRLVKTPKLLVNDSGLACHLCGIEHPDQLAGHPMVGAIAETWFHAELRKILATTIGVEMSYYRTHQQKEVDFVLEGRGRMWGIELKLGQSVGRNDFRGLVDLQEATGSETCGIVAYTGQSVVPFSATLTAVPLSCLIGPGAEVGS